MFQFQLVFLVYFLILFNMNFYDWFVDQRYSLTFLYWSLTKWLTSNLLCVTELREFSPKMLLVEKIFMIVFLSWSGKYLANKVEIRMSLVLSQLLYMKWNQLKKMISTNSVSTFCHCFIKSYLLVLIEN